MQKSLTFLVIITLLAIAILMGLLGFWAFYPYDPVTTGPKPYKIAYPQDHIVEQGKHISYEFAYEKRTNVLPIIYRQFVDGIVFNVSGPQNPAITDIGKGTARIQVKIPETLPPGVYHIRIRAVYKMNPIRNIYYDNITEKFTVVKGEEE